MDQTRAQLRYLRIAPKKVRRIAFLLKGMSYADALAQLRYLPQRSARPLLKLISSAGANAKHNLRLDPNTLAITKILVDPGPSYKRMRERAHGAGFPILKRMSHITVFLGVKAGKPTPTKPEIQAAFGQALEERPETQKRGNRKLSLPRARGGQKQKVVTQARRERVFRRKAI